jgi:hypothetical protein
VTLASPGAIAFGLTIAAPAYAVPTLCTPDRRPPSPPVHSAYYLRRCTGKAVLGTPLTPSPDPGRARAAQTRPRHF